MTAPPDGQSASEGGKIRWKYASFSYQLKRINNWPTDSRIEDFWLPELHNEDTDSQRKEGSPIYPKNRLVFESKTEGGKIRWKYASFSYQLKRIKNWPTDLRIEDFLAS